ncbi:hypothetical protein VST63_16005 [Mycolicibacterium sp. 050232]|uniref:zinc finger domain-containing protein n=1 Tax=Mycolicibacterium sp. 050232 TaxID=3113982 RepID=UPI002E2BDFFC|nr:hypothetical protein [Mycolicibacterium sp. 050232]MED5813863.1 hypothetical protein [Mycolicibacterium sp. 050232]
MTRRPNPRTAAEVVDLDAARQQRQSKPRGNAMPRSGRAIPDAYENTGAGTIDCPNCHAKPGAWCATPDGRRRRVPCVARLAAAPIAPVIDLPDNARAPVDFTEPRHTREETP